MKIKSSPRKERVRAWLRSNTGRLKIIAKETGVPVGWMYSFTRNGGTENPGVDQIDLLYEFMQVDLAREASRPHYPKRAA